MRAAHLIGFTRVTKKFQQPRFHNIYICPRSTATGRISNEAHAGEPFPTYLATHSDTFLVSRRSFNDLTGRRTGKDNYFKNPLFLLPLRQRPRHLVRTCTVCTRTRIRSDARIYWFCTHKNKYFILHRGNYVDRREKNLHLA